MEQIGTKFKKIHNIMGNEFNKNMAKIGLTRSQMEVLMYLIKCKDENVSQRDIEKFFHLTNPTITGILGRLENKGFIARITSTTDARIKNIKVTDKAIDIKETMRKGRREIQKKMFEGISNNDMKTINELLNRIISNIDKQN